VSTAIGIIAFGYLIYKIPRTEIDLFGYFLPRVFLIIFTQIFSYFFLRLYKKGMEDVKYYQNELTTIESKISAIQFYKSVSEDKDLNKLIITEMMRNERNLILSPNQSTSIIEMEKMNKIEGLDKLIDVVKSLVDK